MKILIVGGGGREHALAWKAAQSEQVDRVYVAPGNVGTTRDDKLQNVAIPVTDLMALKDYALAENIDLTIIGPEAPLVAGIVDLFQQAGLACFGPNKAAAILESSKSFTKMFLEKYQIPTATYAVFTEFAPAAEYIRTQIMPIVIKADGLAAGKGVVIATTAEEALQVLDDMLVANKYGSAGKQVVIEEFLTGEEASFIVVTDGEHIMPLASSQDHKARDDSDKGPNTGGMGAYSPAPVIDAAIHDRIMDTIIRPTVKGMASEGRAYCGFLYAGLMIAEDGSPKVLEFNCRLGDPEAQVILLRLKSDLISLCTAVTERKLDHCHIDWDPRCALGIVAAAAGYPSSAKQGDTITGLDTHFPDGIKIFHSGTAYNDDQIVTAGGRVLCATALGDSVKAAQQRAYASIEAINYSGMFYRRDIGYRAIAREDG